MPTETTSNAVVFDMPDAEILLYRNFFDASESSALFQELSQNIAWQQQNIKIAGKSIPIPRLTAWYGDPGTSYSYSGITVNPLPWTPALLQIKDRVEAVAKCRFNSVLLNFYRSEQDSVAWHSDDERELGTNPVIASVSFGAERNFQFKHKHRPELRQTINLTPGSLLLMRGTTQHYWRHQIPKTKVATGPRINLTFRTIK